MSNSQKFEQLKKAVTKEREKAAKIEGILESQMTTLSTKFQTHSLEEGELLLKKTETEASLLQEQASQELQKLEKAFPHLFSG